MRMHLKTIVGPASELHLTVLVVEREPCDVNQAGGLGRIKWLYFRFSSTSNILWIFFIFWAPWIFQAGCMCSGLHWWRPHLSDTSHQTSHPRCNSVVNGQMIKFHLTSCFADPGLLWFCSLFLNNIQCSLAEHFSLVFWLSELELNPKPVS